MSFASCSIYLISPPHISDVTAFAEQLKATLGVGGVGAFQLRLKGDRVLSRYTEPRFPLEGEPKSPLPLPPTAGREGRGDFGGGYKKSVLDTPPGSPYGSPALPQGEGGVRVERNSSGQRLTLPLAPDDAVLRAAEALLPICHAHEIPLILNDNPALAKQCGADGVHLGQEDGSVAEARALLGEDAVIGVSCHASQHLAMEAAEQGADYVAFGAFFPTRSKSAEALAHWGTPPPEILEWWSRWTEIPCVAIGGVTPENCAPLVRAGADFLAAITAVWSHPQGPAAATRAFREAIRASAG